MTIELTHKFLGSGRLLPVAELIDTDGAAVALFKLKRTKKNGQLKLDFPRKITVLRTGTVVGCRISNLNTGYTIVVPISFDGQNVEI